MNEVILVFLLHLFSNALATGDVVFGSVIRMNCFNETNGYRIKNHEFIWLKNGALIYGNDRIISKQRNSLIMITYAMKEDVGNYTCYTVINGKPDRQLSKFEITNVVCESVFLFFLFFLFFVLKMRTIYNVRTQ